MKNKLLVKLMQISVLLFVFYGNAQAINATDKEFNITVNKDQLTNRNVGILENPDVSKIHGNIKFVNSFPDFKVKIVDHFADLHVKIVSNFPDEPGLWKIVDSFPDYKIKIVDSFPDFTIKFVDHFPGPQK